MKTDYIKWIVTAVIGLAVLWTGGGRSAAQTTDTTRTSTYGNGLSKAAKVAPNVDITYPKTTSGTPLDYFCVGDIIQVKATADNIEDLIVPVDNAIHKYWSGDDFVEKVDNTITKRFYTYHPYATSNPETASDQEFEFIVTYNGNQTEKIKKTIRAKSCPPEISALPVLAGTGTTRQIYHNLGYIRFEFSCKNPTAKVDRTTFTKHFDPDQRWFQSGDPIYSSEGWLGFRHICIPVSDAAYTVAVQFNEGDSLRIQSLGPYNVRVASLTGITTDKKAYCSGDRIVFELDLSDLSNLSDLPKDLQANSKDLYYNILQQTIDGNESKIAACFDWTGSPSTVEFIGMTGTTCTFKTEAAETTTPYQCKMSVKLRYQANSTSPLIELPLTYDLPIASFTVHSAQSLTQETIDACEGATINLNDYLSGTGLTIEGYTGANGFTKGTAYTVPGQTETIKVKINSGNCGIFEPDLTVNVTPKPQITQIQGISNGMEICAGTSLNVSASVTPEKADVMWQVDGVQVSDKPSTELSLGKDATVTVQASNTCGDTPEQSFTVKVNALPQVSMASLIEQCPGTTVTLSGSGNGSNANYQLRDLKTNQPIAPTGFDAATGLNGYPLAEGDDLELTYTAYNGKCPASATARITAHPLPEVQITYDGQAYGDGATLCVPRRQPFSLSASGANTYAWSQDGTGITTPDFNLADDAAVTVKGTDATTTCAKDITVQCVVSVEHADRINSAIVCPYNNVCFKADLLPNTTYAWFGPQGTDLTHSTEQFCFQPTTDPGQTGTYTLKTERKGCKEELRYELDFHPYPRLIGEGNPPICEDETLIFRCQHGLSKADIQSCILTDLSGTEVPNPTITDASIEYRIPNIQPAQAGRYMLTVTTIKGCTQQLLTDITVGTHITPEFSLAASYCEDEAETLTTPTTGAGYTYRWFTDSRSLNTDETDPTVRTVWRRTDNGTLYLEIKQTGCTDMFSRPLTVIPRPHLSGMPQDTGLCDGMPLCLNPVADLRPDQITWFFIGTDGQPTTLEQGANPDLAYCWEHVDALMNGRYFVDAAYQGCIGRSDTMSLTVYPLPDIRIEGPTFICDGDTVTLTAVSGTPGTNRWSPSGQTTEAIKVTEAGRYAVTRTSTHGCDHMAETSLEARPRPYFSLADDTSFCRGTSFMIYGPDGMDAYLWNDGSEEKDRLVEDEGWYILTVFRNECPFTDSLFADETFCGQFHFPTAFTPNDNRVNDTWGAISAAKDEDMAEYDLMVFDRNGKKVFHGKRISEQWDGRYKGQLCPPGVYTYSFRALEKEEGLKYRSSGTVTIVL